MSARADTIFKPRRINKSILSDDDVKEVLINAYPSIFSAKKFADGSACLLCCGVNDTYKISIADNNHGHSNYIYRIYTHQWKTKEAILAEIRVINDLKNDLNMAHYPINTESGEWITGIEMPEGIRYGVLLSYVAGSMTSCTLETSYLIGQQLALLHIAFDEQANQDALPIYNEDSLVKKPVANILKAMQTSRNGSIERLKKCNRSLYDLPMPRLPRTAYGLCHGDAHFNNTVISNNGNIEFIDFDLCGYGVRTYDLATVMWKIELRADTRAQKSRMQLALLRGYEHVQELTDEEKITIPTFMAWRHIFWLGAQAKLLPNLYGYLLLSNDYYNTHLGWLENWITQGHSDCTRMILSGDLQLQVNEFVSVTDLQIEWWQKQRTGLMLRLLREDNLCRDVMHFAHLHSEDNLIEFLLAEPSAHLTNSI